MLFASGNGKTIHGLGVSERNNDNGVKLYNNFKTLLY